MALDGLVISNLVYDLNQKLINGHINKISQPEPDDIVLNIKNNREQYKLFISANASLPLMYLTNENKTNPMTAPNFCMLLRKHLNSAKIISITQPSLERIVDIEIEHLNELGDVCTKHLMIEIMGKHSNIIFIDDNKKIIDSIKHISGFISSLREVLPNKDYFIPPTQDKINPFELDIEKYKNILLKKPMTIDKAIYSSLTGISPIIAIQLCIMSSINADTNTSELSEAESLHLYKNIERFIDNIRLHNYTPNILYKNNEPLEFSSIPLTSYSGTNIIVKHFDNISDVLETYYSQKSIITRIHQKSTDLRKIINNALSRARKKYDLQLKQLKDTEKRDKYRIYGELINTYGYNLSGGEKEFTALNYYTNEEIKIPLDPTLTAIENSKKYFDKYNKLKRTYEALTELIKETAAEIEHLESISNSLNIALIEDDLTAIKDELIQFGYMKRKFTKGKQKVKKSNSQPFHYISSDGYHIYIGRNNFQNDELTFKFANGNDWWFHAKKIAGSHVIVKSDGNELPDRTFEEAAKLAGYYSSSRGTPKVDIDYTLKKNIKKPNASKPGFVIYHTNYSMTIEPNIDGILQV